MVLSSTNFRRGIYGKFSPSPLGLKEILGLGRVGKRVEEEPRGLEG
jgi:hypothetical protein